MFKRNQWITLILASLSGAIIYRLPYLRDQFYIPLQEATGSTNAQLGLLVGAFGLGQFLLYFPAGWASDRFSTKKLLTFSCISTGLLGFWYAALPSFIALLILHGMFAITTVFTFWTAIVKLIRLMASDEDQGKMYGFWTFGKGVVSTIAGFAATMIFTSAGEGISGLKATIIFYSILIIIIGVLFFFLLDENVENSKSEDGTPKEVKKATAAETWAVLKMPEIWLTGLVVFIVWGNWISFGMVTPYLTDVFNMSTGIASGVSVVRAHILFALGGLVGGILTHKLGSTTKFINYAFIGTILFTLVFYFTPGNPDNIWFVLGAMVILGIFINGANAVFYSVINEICIPPHLTGTAAGIISLIGYMPEIFLYTFVGNLVDRNPGIVGYQHVFLYMIISSLVGLVVGTILYKRAKICQVNKVAQ